MKEKKLGELTLNELTDICQNNGYRCKECALQGYCGWSWLAYTKGDLDKIIKQKPLTSFYLKYLRTENAVYSLTLSYQVDKWVVSYAGHCSYYETQILFSKN